MSDLLTLEKPRDIDKCVCVCVLRVGVGVGVGLGMCVWWWWCEWCGEWDMSRVWGIEIVGRVWGGRKSVKEINWSNERKY